MELEKISEYAKGDLEEIVTTYVWEPIDENGERHDVTLRIEVRRKVSGKYYAIPSHQAESPQQAAPYFTMDEKDTPEDALYYCISGLKKHMRTAEETQWPLLKCK